jgi:hypothetical protein
LIHAASWNWVIFCQYSVGDQSGIDLEVHGGNENRFSREKDRGLAMGLQRICISPLAQLLSCQGILPKITGLPLPFYLGIGISIIDFY